MKVSVIIPIYNAAPYVERCCRSLLEQSLEDIEYIFISDGSMDDSVQIVRQVAALYPSRQIRILEHQDNCGISFTREQGLREAHGDYVIYCDADDWVDADMYERLLRVADAEMADVVCCGMQVERAGKQLTEALWSAEPYQLSFAIGPLVGSVCLKLIRRTLLTEHDIHFPTGVNWGEDFVVSIMAQILAKRVAIVPYWTPYHYVQHTSSITHSPSINKCEQLVGCAAAVEAYLSHLGLAEQYVHELDYLRFQTAQYFLIYPQCRDLQRWRQYAPHSIPSTGVAQYLRVAAWLANHYADTMCHIFLKIKDVISTFARR